MVCYAQAFLLATLVSAINNLLQHVYPEVHTEVKAICTCTSCADSTRLYLYSLEECDAAMTANTKLLCKFSNAQVRKRCCMILLPTKHNLKGVKGIDTFS